MKIEYDPGRDLLYLWFGAPGQKAARTLTVVPGMHADFDTAGKLVGIEVLDASEILGEKVQFEVRLVPIVRGDRPRKAGLSQGQIWTSDDFDQPLSDDFWAGSS